MGVPKDMWQAIVNNYPGPAAIVQPQFPLINQALVSQEIGTADLEKSRRQIGMSSRPKKRTPQRRSHVGVYISIIQRDGLGGQCKSILKRLSASIQILVLVGQVLWRQRWQDT